MTNGPRNAVEDWTGTAPLMCPWKAFYDPFVARVLEAYGSFESGNLSVEMPHPSHRLLRGVTFFHKVMNRITSKQLEQDRKERERREAGR